MSESRFKRVMRWVLSEGPQPDEPGLESDEHLGQWILPDKRGLGYLESDTGLEVELSKALDSHYVKNSSSELENIWDELMELSRAGLYKDWLQPPTGPVYRGINLLKPNAAAKVLGLPVDEIEATKNKVMLHSDGGIHQSINNNISSWTVDCDMAARRFAKLYSGYVSIILRAQCTPNGDTGEFLMNHDKVPGEFVHFDRAYLKFNIADENEVIANGPVRWDRAAWVYVSPISKYERITKSERKEITDKLCKAVQ